MLQALGITKRYPSGVVANAEVDLELRPGEVHAVLGENGAGKTTLMRILAGLLQPNEGAIHIDGHPVPINSPRTAIAHGIGMVHQHFSLVPGLTVAENIALGYSRPGVAFRHAYWERQLRAAAAELGLDVDPAAVVAKLSMGEQQRVEVFRVLLEGSRFLILDEPTSLLAPQEARWLFDYLEHFTAKGNAVLLVTHKIHHVLDFADRVTVLRRGRVVSSDGISGYTAESLAMEMVGEPVEDVAHAPASGGQTPPPCLEVRGLSTSSHGSGPGLIAVTFALRPGEILGVAGVAGNGQDALIAALFDASLRNLSVHLTRPEDGRVPIALVSADRLTYGLVPSLNLAENLNLHNARLSRFRRGPFLSRSRLSDAAVALINGFEIRPGSPDAAPSALSGGNAQRAVLAREFTREPSVLVAASPTAGLDVRGVRQIHESLLGVAQRDGSVLLISEDLDELLALCDRIIVLFGGSVLGEFARPDFDRHRIGLCMSGVAPSETPAA